MGHSHQEIFEHYMHAGAIMRDPEAVAGLFTEDGVYETPLVPQGHVLPRRLAGRDAIRAGIAVYQRTLASPGSVDAERSRCVLHDTPDPDVFIVELDAVLEDPAGQSVTVSLVQIFRIRDGLIVSLRDYFAPGAPAGTP